MARRVFFSFHYERDIWRVGQVRNSGIILSPGDTTSGFIDAVEWESLERQGSAAVQRWIDGELDRTSVTVVLVGAQTARRPWVGYEIQKSVGRGNGLLGIYIDGVKDANGFLDVRGSNPFDMWKSEHTGRLLSETYRTYDWVLQDGRRHLASWVEQAARDAGR